MFFVGQPAWEARATLDQAIRDRTEKNTSEPLFQGELYCDDTLYLYTEGKLKRCLARAPDACASHDRSSPPSTLVRDPVIFAPLALHLRSGPVPPASIRRC